MVNAALPETVTSALHEGVPTSLSMPKIRKRIQTAPVYGRCPIRQQYLTNPEPSDPLRLLERVETSEGFYAMRNRLTKKANAFMPTQRKQDFPNYLALDPLEEHVMRTNMKRQAVNRWKQLHAGNDERCSFLVQKWIQDGKYDLTK